MFRNVQLRVKQTIGQDPWLSFPSLPAVYFAGAKSSEDEDLKFWGSLKDKKDPTALAAYLERYPGGTFAILARTFIEQHDQQMRVEEAMREEQRKRQEEVRKTAEVKRLEQEKQIREVALEQDRSRAEATSNTIQMRLLEEQRRESVRRSTELHTALEEARLAQEAAKVAEEQRLAAVKAAEEAVRLRDRLLLARNLQDELKRVGCYEGPLDGNWSAAAKQALSNFSKLANVTAVSDQPVDAILAIVKSKTGRVCVPACAAPGETMVNGKCVANGLSESNARPNRAAKKAVAEQLPKPKLCYSRDGAQPTRLYRCGSPQAGPLQAN
jgi:hypothetical protein